MKGNKTFSVIGIGTFGNAIAKRLSRKGSEVIAVDTDEHLLELIQDDVSSAVALDATDKKALKNENIHQADAVVVSIGDNFNAVLICVVHLMELGAKRIIARANNPEQQLVLEKIGVKEILLPEKEISVIVAERLQNPDIVTFMSLPDNYEVAEIKVPKKLAYRKLSEVAFQVNYNLNLLAVSEEKAATDKSGEEIKEHHILKTPDENLILRNSDNLLIFGKIEDIERFISINS